ncbi:glycosyl hydrolase [Frankia sp. R82]|uniref:glycoside hydrolase family 26 protein n=1 Tax=Frankia sp. R82 TaxID=2950553 RepID=UPI0027E28CCE|nr:glycosyl hydrolase [Frankia sp. R82]
MGLLQATISPANAAPVTSTPAPASTPGVDTAASASASASPSGSTPVPGVPLTTMTPSATSRIALVLFDEDIVLVGGRGFAPDNDVSVAAQTTRLGGSALIRSDTDGRFILGFRVPPDFKGAVNVKATQGGTGATGSLDVVGPQAAAEEFKTAPPLPNLPVGSAGSTAAGPSGPAVASPTASPASSDQSTADVPRPTAATPSVTLAPTPSARPTTRPVTPETTGPQTVTPAVPSPATAASSPAAAETATAGGTSSGAVAGSGAGDTRGTQSGLPWMSGYQSHQLASLTQFGNWRGRPNDLVHVYTTRTAGWGGLVDPTSLMDQFKTFPGKLLISEPTYPQGQGSNGECATGAYDDQWKKLGTSLVAHNRADSIVRIGWEFNGTFMYWHSDSDAAAFKTCFQKISAAIRSTDPQVKIDWTFNAHASPVPSGNSPWSAYPGDQYVDYVGIDSYDHFPASKDDATWNKQCEDVNGLCYVIRFAQQHGKKVGVGEWGVASCSGDGGGDNPFYIKKMYDTFKSAGTAMGYDAYFADAAPGNVCSTIMNGGQNPKSAAEYKTLFGTGTG